MSKTIVSKSELTAIVLAEIRRHRGCDGVDSVVIQENSRARLLANWEISIVAASSGDPSTVHRTVASVQKALQDRYQIGDAQAHRFRAGDRVRLSEIGRTRFPARQSDLGTIAADRRKSDGDSVRVLFDGSKSAARLHQSFIEPAPPE